MSFKSLPFHSMKKFIKDIEMRLPLNIKIVAEVRFLWKDIVGVHMADHSQVVKCEYIPKKNAQGQSSGEFYRKLLIWVDSKEIQTVMTTYVGEYLERIPKRLKIHSMRIQYTHKPITMFHQSFVIPEKTDILSLQETEQIIQRVENLNVDKDTSHALTNFLVVWKTQQKRDNV